MYTNAVSLATAGHDVLLECETPRALPRLKKADNSYTNAVALATAGHDVLKECEAVRAAGSRWSKKGDNLYTDAVVQASAGHTVLHEAQAPRRRTRRSKKHGALCTQAVSLAAAVPDGLLECEAPRSLLKLKDGDNLYTNAVSLATAGHAVLRECEASRLASGSESLEKVANLYTNAVVQATGGHDVFGDTGVYLVHADELVSLQRNGIGGEEDGLRVLGEDRGRVPWIRARGTQPSCSADIFSHFDLELLASDDIANLVAGARPCTRDVSVLTGGSPEVLTSSADQPCLLLAAKGVAQSGVTGPPTPEIVHDRGRSPSADSVPSPDQQDHATFAPGELLRIVESCAPDGTNPVPNEQLMITKEQGTGAPASQCAKSRPQLQGAQEVQPKAPRKRRYMPKILSEKPKRSRAKKPRGKVTPDEASPPVLIQETSSPSLLQMKMLARHKKPQMKRRRCVKRQKRDEATTTLSKDPPAAHTTGRNEELQNAGTIQEPTCQLNTDGQHSGSSQCADPSLLPALNRSVIEKSSTQGKGREHVDAGPVDDCNAPEFSKFLQDSLFSDPLTRNCETSSSQIPLADQGSSNLVPVPKPNQGSSFGSEVLVDACLRIPGNVMSIDELRNALDPVSSWPSGAPDLSPVDRVCAPDVEEFLAVDEDRPSTPRGSVPSVNPCQDFTLVMPPSPPSPPSPRGAADWNGGFSRVSAASTRRTLKFDAQVDELQLTESQLVLSKDARARNEAAGLVQAMVGGIAEQESPPRAVHITGLEIQVIEENCVPALPLLEPVQLPMDSSARREEELQIVAYDDGSKKMVVYKKPPMRKRRVRFKPKVDLDFSTVKKFKTLMLKGSDEDDTDQDKASWEQSRQQWQNRAHQFISIMRQVQGNRAFSRWKGSVVDSVGGAFLTQNVSDFLSSNAFMALRARFPARRSAAKEHTGTSAPEMKDQPPLQKEFSLPQPERLTTVELKKLRMTEDRKQEEASEMVAALLSKNVKQHECVDEELTEIVETLRTRLMGCHIEQGNHEHIDAVAMRGNEVVMRRSTWSLWQKSRELREALDTQLSLQPCFETECTPNENAMEGARALESDHNLVSNSLPSGDTLMNQLTGNVFPKCLEVSLFEDQEWPSEEVCISSSFVQQDEFQVVENRDGELNPPGSSWKGKLAVIQEKFSTVVEESVSSLTVVGKEKVLAATLRQVLGKKQTTREGDKAKARALKTVKLRPERALMRRRIDNYRYRQGNVSFRLLSGEARASWEAGYVMKSQKHKWEPLRANILADESYSPDPLTEDCVDWEAVQRASVHEVADVIKNRGMNNALAGRLKAFLDRVHRDQNGSIDLEWIRKLPPEDAKAFLLSFRGVGLKSVECIRLLTLHHPSFPVDTNVGRIAVRLGWVPLEPLPEETQLHLLDLYPIQSHIQQYMWPRLCTLDQQTLYELHYQMITFGKVFCTKSKPNCNACPLRSECKHYASSYASAKLLLKWPEKQDKQSPVFALLGPDPPAGTEPTPHSTVINEDPCIPIIEEPRSPEPYTESSVPNSNIPDCDIPDIEELPFHIDYNTKGDPAETQIEPPSGFSFIIGELRSLLDIKETSLDLSSDPESDEFASPPTNSKDRLQPQVVEYEEEEALELDISDNTEVFSEDTRVTIEEAMDLNVDTVVMAVENIHEVTIEEEMEVVTDEFQHLPSQELILLPPQASLAPAPKLKNVQRLRTVHFVYELPDNHPLLFEMDQREADDPCFYLLAIWSPDEVPATMPKINDDETSNPFASCDDNDPEQTVRGTLLIPCKTAMRGWFPLNGTYFQVNEVFADHASSIQPIDVPRTLLWSLRRRFVYFSTAVSNLFKDMSQEEIQCCFQKGYVCLRAFDMTTRQPKLLAPRLHQSGAKIVKAPASRKGQGRGRPRKDTPKDKSKSITNQNSTSKATVVGTTTVTVVTRIDL